MKMKTLYYSMIAILILALFSLSDVSVQATNPFTPEYYATIDKINYNNTEHPIILIHGTPNTSLAIKIRDYSDQEKFSDIIKLGSNGTARYSLDITSYTLGVYRAFLGYGFDRIDLGFSVGLMPSGSRMMLNVEKDAYLPGDNISILGISQPNAIIQISLIDPTGLSVGSIQITSDNTGHFSSSDLMIPQYAMSGSWSIAATSGVTHIQTHIKVNLSASIKHVRDNSSTIIQNYGQRSMVHAILLKSPLKQFKSGVTANNIICRPDLQLLIENQENLPICVKINSVSNLLHQDWSYPTNCKYVHDPFTAGVAGLIVIEKNAIDPSSGKSYSPRNSTVVIGWNNTVSWINQDVAASSVTSDWNLFDSGPILPGADWQHSFECVGNYGYHSEPHPWMKGWIRVLPPSR